MAQVGWESRTAVLWRGSAVAEVGPCTGRRDWKSWRKPGGNGYIGQHPTVSMLRFPTILGRIPSIRAS